MTELLEAFGETSALEPEVRLFLAAAPSPVLRAAWLTSISLGLRAEDLVDLCVRLWPKDQPVEPTILDDFPIFRQAAGFIELADYAVGAISSDFRSRDQEKYLDAHQILVAGEEATLDDEDEWLIAGRIAFYLAALDETESSARFRSSFSRPPSYSDQTRYRMWLTSLALRQQPLLPSFSRDSLFYSAYRFYISGQRRLAHDAFEEVLLADQRDEIHAIALHLSAVLESDLEVRRQRLEESVELSETLELEVNEVMARNTLVTTLLGRTPDNVSLTRALELARVNREKARHSSDPGLLPWCTRTWAATEWEFSTSHAPPRSDLASQLITELDAARDEAFGTAELDTALYIANTAAVIARDVGDYTQAMEFIDGTISRMSHFGARPYRALNRVTQTLRSIRNASGDPDQRASRLLDRIAVLMAA